MLEGFYRIAFTGVAGSGFGMLVFQKGTIAGADMAGATYDGTYQSNAETDLHEFQITVTFPAGVTPVQTGIPLAAPSRLNFNGKMSLNDISNDEPVLIQTPIGPINVLFSKIRNVP